MELLLIRHGQSEADILGRHEGRADYPLTELGVQQATWMAQWVKQNHMPSRILSSTLKRAARTAQILGETAGITVDYLPELMEFNNGLLAGLTYEEATAKYPKPEVIRPHDRNYEQETTIEFRARAEAVLSRVIYDYSTNTRIAIVSHGGMINMLFRSFLRLPVDTGFYIHTADTGVHLLKVDGAQRGIAFLNSTLHLQNS